MNAPIPTGWNPADEERDFDMFSTECRGSILQWSDVEAQVVAESRNPFVSNIDDIVATLFREGRSEYGKYVPGIQETNDCVSWGTSNGCDLSQATQAWRGIETKLYRTAKYWVYGVGKCLAGQHADNGMSVSLAMKHIAQYGVLPEDLTGLPKYSGALQRRLLRDGNSFFEQWKDKAILYDVQVVQIPLDFEAWYLWASSGRWITYGTGQRLALRDGEFELNGGWSHCMAAGGPVWPKDRAIMNVNSHSGSNFGRLRPEVAREVIRRCGSFGTAFGIWKFTPREVKPDYSGLGRN